VYWPLIGFLLGMGAIVEAWLTRWPRRQSYVLSIGWVLVAACTVRTIQECRIWKNDETLFSAAVARGSQKERDLTSLGLCRHRAGNYDEAIRWYRQALQVSPNYGRAIYLLGCAYGAKGDYDSAITCFQRDLTLNPAESTSALPLAEAYEMKGDLAAAQRVLQTAAATANSPPAALALAKLYGTHGSLSAAEQLLHSILAQYPNNAEGHALLGWVLLQQNRLPAAEQQLRLALRYDPQSTLALNTLTDFEKRRSR
jgi:tetratricopeptide (TPR) repeat protein